MCLVGEHSSVGWPQPDFSGGVNLFSCLVNFGWTEWIRTVGCLLACIISLRASSSSSQALALGATTKLMFLEPPRPVRPRRPLRRLPFPPVASNSAAGGGATSAGATLANSRREKGDGREESSTGSRGATALPAGVG